MKNIKILIFSMIVVFGITSCYEENNITPALFDSKGKVPYISVFWAGPTRLTTNFLTDANADVNLVIEYLSEVPVKDVRLLFRTGTTGTFNLIQTIPFANAGAVYDTKLRNYVVKIPIKAPATKNATVQYAAELTGTNDLIGVQRTVTVRSRP
jgi:hypothetical protein